MPPPRRRPRIPSPAPFADAAPAARLDNVSTPPATASSGGAGASSSTGHVLERPVTVRELASFYRVAPLTIRRLLGRGLPFFHVGAQLRFRLTDVDKFFREQPPPGRKR